MALNIKTVLQPQGAEIIFRQRAGEKAPGLVPELGHPLLHHALVDFVVDVHLATSVKSLKRMVAITT
jgi:hypothetical protein